MAFTRWIIEWVMTRYHEPWLHMLDATPTGLSVAADYLSEHEDPDARQEQTLRYLACRGTGEISLPQKRIVGKSSRLTVCFMVEEVSPKYEVRLVTLEGDCLLMQLGDHERRKFTRKVQAIQISLQHTERHLCQFAWMLQCERLSHGLIQRDGKRGHGYLVSGRHHLVQLGKVLDVCRSRRAAVNRKINGFY